MTRRMMGRVVAITITAALLPAVSPAQDGEDGMDGRWRISAMGGWVGYEGDEPMEDAALGALTLGFDLSRRWTLEGVIEVCPDLESSYRRDWATGERISRMSEDAGRELTETSAIRFGLDGLLHLAPEHRFDPYLAAGIGLAAHDDDVDERYEPLVRAGAGLFANINRNWALRLDSRVVVAGTDTEFNLVTTAGLAFRPGSSATHPATVYAPPPSAEAVTPASVAVTPASVAVTSASVAVTPASVAVTPAAVADKPAAEAVKMFVLNLNFDPGKWEIKSEYRSELDVIGRFLDKRSGATARIEGHEKATEGTEDEAAQILSEKRAGAVRDYMKDNWKIRASRMTAAGFGTSRPVEAPGQSSERIEVFITAP